MLESIEKFLTIEGPGILLRYGTSILGAIAILLIGLWLIARLNVYIRKSLTKSLNDETFAKFLANIISVVLKVVLILTAAGFLGVQTTSFIAILGSAGLAVGLALQGSLGNFAGSVLIMIFRPFKVGELIEAQGHLGHVKEIQAFTTILISLENQSIIIPNGPLSNGSIKNYTREGKIRVDLVIGVSYDTDIDEARKVLEESMKADPKVLQNPAPSVNVLELGDSSVNLAVRPWCDPEVYWDVYFATLENGKKALDKNKIEIPFPQRVIHYSKDAAKEG